MTRFLAGWMIAASAWAADEKARLHAVPDVDKNLKTGPAVGSKIPAFEAIDQSGARQTFETLKGPKGLALLFTRSADWCPFCKAQLVELGQQQEAYRKKGMGVASLTYDSAEMLRNFAERKGLHYPMLSDPESKIIRDFGILNDNLPKDTPFYGAPFPGMYVIDEHGVVKAKYFEEDHRERYTAANILVRQFGEKGEGQGVVETPHLRLSYSASNMTLGPGGKAALILDIDLKPGMHLYAPGVTGGYISLDWQSADSKAWLAGPVTYPPSHDFRMEVIDETVPVYEGHIRLLRDVTIGQQPELAPVLGADRTLTVEGAFKYQACDTQKCYLPRSVPLKWTFKIDKLDSQRGPAGLQRKPKQDKEQ